MRDDAAVQAIELVARATVGLTTRALAETTPELNLSLLQWRAVLIIGDDSAGLRVGEVGDGVGVPLPAASRLVGRLQRRGLVRLERDADDGRAMRVRLTLAGSATRSAVLDRRRALISAALGQMVVPAEAVRGLHAVAARLTDPHWEVPAAGTAPGWGPERGTMSETIKTGSFATGEETTPDKDAQERALHRGSFATGEETTPDKDAQERALHRGSFATGEETTPDKDAEKRLHPGTFADEEIKKP